MSANLSPSCQKIEVDPCALCKALLLAIGLNYSHELDLKAIFGDQSEDLGLEFDGTCRSTGGVLISKCIYTLFHNERNQVRRSEDEGGARI